MAFDAPRNFDYQLLDRYNQQDGRVFLTGTQALVRILLDQARRDHGAGLKSAGFVSGYRGSPLGSVDLELWRAKTVLAEHGIEFLPAVNEDLAATAVLGSQQVETSPEREVDGVFGMWYGKGPGVDRAGDALKHGNAYGCSPHGGVLVVAGDDHGCVSSSMPHQSDVAFMAAFMPILNPASVSEYLEFGEYGYALSRFSGTWVGFKAISETVESAATVRLPRDREFVLPKLAPWPGGLYYRKLDLPGTEIEERMEAKKHAVYAFAHANPIDKVIYGSKRARFGIVTTGKGHLDLMEALRLLGVDGAAARRLGIEVYKVGMVWPLARHDALEFVRSKEEVLIVEEKRGIIESQLKEYFYDWDGDKPRRMVGKHDETGARLIPWTGELSPRQLVPLLARRLDGVFPTEGFSARAKQLLAQKSVNLNIAGATRTPYFCSGCPHNTSTKVPEGSRAQAGIGCHFMATWMGRETSSLIQMGGEGVNWAAASKFLGHGHVFQNLGEGTWYHSGSMAIRQAIAAKANITYKILYNDAVAMTGGQPVDGPISVSAIAQVCRAEGVARIAIVSDQIEKFHRADFPSETSFNDRRDLDAVQREMRKIKGVSVLIYEQTCAAEKRRRRKRGLMDDPQKFAVINPLVCEGCGDCSVQSNCLSVEPLETEFGRKRKINLSSCNKDFSCVTGFCPSFVTLEGAVRKTRSMMDLDIVHLTADLPSPELRPLDTPYDLLVTGVGGTGVVTIGALITMAAHLEGQGASVLDFTGFAQKFGPVLSFVRLGATPDDLYQVRIDRTSADAVIGCDIVVSSSPKASATYHAGTKVALNTAEMPTGDLVLSPDASLKVGTRLRAIKEAVGADNTYAIDANKAAETLLGDSVFANVMMLGFAWQQGLVPVSQVALARAIDLNAVKVQMNHAAFALGRVLAVDPARLSLTHERPRPESTTAAQIIAQYQALLCAHSTPTYAARYEATLARFTAHLPEDIGDGMIEKLLVEAGRSLGKLMAYKDEYEVARLHLDPAFQAYLEQEFEPGFHVTYHLAPPILTAGLDARGRPLKRRFGAWMRGVFRVLARLKLLRGTPLDPFGQSAERRQEREMIAWFEGVLEKTSTNIRLETCDAWLELLSQPQKFRGYGPVKEAAIQTLKPEADKKIAELLQS